MSKHQLNIWDMTDKNDPECIESVYLELEDNRYGDNEEAMYFTGHTKLGKFVEVVVTVPEREKKNGKEKTGKGS